MLALQPSLSSQASSRSHAIMQLSVEMTTELTGGQTVIRKAKLNMARAHGALGV